MSVAWHTSYLVTRPWPLDPDTGAANTNSLTEEDSSLSSAYT